MIRRKKWMKEKTIFLSVDTRKIIDKYVEEYNCRRLHSNIYYLPPRDVLEGRMEVRLKEREEKLRRAKEIRKQKAL